MLTVIKTIITTVLLSTLLAMAGNVEARLKYYRYNDNIPMVEMSLNMMVAMGVLEPIPSRLVHDGNPYHRMVNASYSPYSRSAYSSYPGRSRRYSNYSYNDYLDGPISPYDAYYSRYKGSRYSYTPDYPGYRTWGSYWDSPWADRWNNQWDGPWSDTWGSPWDYQRGNPWNSYGRSPWGNQWSNPWNSYWDSPWGNQWNSPWNSYGGSPWGNQWSNPWNSYWGSPWGNSWNNPWMNPWSSQLGYPGAWPYTPGYSNLPLSPDAILGNDASKYNSYQSDDSSQRYNHKDGYTAEKTSWSGRPSRASYKRSGSRGGKKRPYRQLNGLWIGENGEMLGIRGNRFLWYDDNQYAKGRLATSPTIMKARIEGADSAVRYHYKLHGNELVIMSRNGKMRTFNRMPLIELPTASVKPRAAYTSYKPESDYSHVSYSNFQSGLKPDRRSLNLRSRSDRAAPAVGPYKRSGSEAPRKYYSARRFEMQNTPVPSKAKKSMQDIPSASVAVDSERHAYAYTGKASINDSDYHAGKHQQATAFSSVDARASVPTSTIPLFQKYLPAAAKPKSSSGAESDLQPAKDINIGASTWNSGAAGLDMNDPNTYLYSYLKDSDYKRTASSSSIDTDKRDSSAMAVNNHRSNIWKPNRLFPDQRQNSWQAQSELAANSKMRKFTWPRTGSWD